MDEDQSENGSSSPCDSAKDSCCRKLIHGFQLHILPGVVLHIAESGWTPILNFAKKIQSMYVILFVDNMLLVHDSFLIFT